MRYNAQQYAKALHDLAKEAALAKHREVIKQFLDTVGRNGSLSLLPEIIREFELLADKEAGIREVAIRTPERMAAEAVAERLPFKAKVKAQVDVRLKGGVVLEVGDLRVDNSVAMRLERAREAFTE